ncbi:MULTISPECIES: autoinducer binding domain-containing protein [unclassified Pseudomonas]|uniref:autoinducer binding domain-containing protein n=1 Tax=Pseudomonas sp. GL-R-19 TaxID=2832391 RepID=UPI001C49A616
MGVKPGPGTPNQQVLIQGNYPVTWRNHYNSQAYAAIDPIAHHCLNSNLALLWNRENYRQPAESAFFEEAAMHGLQLGWQPFATDLTRTPCNQTGSERPKAAFLDIGRLTCRGFIPALVQRCNKLHWPRRPVAPRNPRTDSTCDWKRSSARTPLAS